MKSLARCLSLFLVPILLLAPGAYTVGQTKQSGDLEKRVELLEQRIRILEGRISMFLGGKGVEVRRVNQIMLQDFTNIARLAREYYLRSSMDTGQPQSFVGLVLPPNVAQTELASYSIVSRDTDIMIIGTPTTLTAGMSAHVGVDGKFRDWTYTGEFAGVHDLGTAKSPEYNQRWEDFNHEISNIAALAFQYCQRPRTAGGGGGSYTGFVLPRALAMTNTGNYRAIATDTILIVEGLSIASRTLKRAYFDNRGNLQKTVSNNFGGEMKKPQVGPRTAADSVLDIVNADFANIASRAFEYKRRAVAQGGGGGAYTGYLSAQVASSDGSTDYTIEITPQWIVLTAVSQRGLGTASARIDSNGKLWGWAYTGKLAQ